MSVLPVPYAALVRGLLVGHGLRVSEALRLTRASLTLPSGISVQPSKGSNARTLLDASLVSLADALTPASPAALLIPYSYRDVYEHCKRIGIAYTPTGAQRQRVTHAGRARFIQSLVASGLTHAEAAAVVGLRNESVVPLYLT